MPARVARSNIAAAQPKTARNKNKKRSLNAFAIASHSAPDKLRIKQHRLGESLGDEPRQKRRRLADDEEESEDEEHASSARRRQEKAVTKRTGTGARGGLDEEAEQGSDSSGNEWTMGGMAENDGESDLDSDEAFGESDEERFEGFTFRGSSGGKQPARKKRKQETDQAGEDEIDLNEQASEEEEDEDDLGDEAVDLATMLDESDDEVTGGQKRAQESRGEDSTSDDDDESVDEDEEPDSESENDDADQLDEEKRSKFQDFIESLPTGNESTKPNKARAVEIHEGQEPSDFIATKGKLTMDDLFASTDMKAFVPDASARKVVEADARQRPSAQKLKETAPLPKRQQDKLDREVASKKAKEQLDRWRDTVIQNRRAEFLQFPLKDPNASEPLGQDKFIPADQETPANELEETIQSIMEQSGMISKNKKGDEEDDIMKAEALETNKLPVDEVLKRRAELRRSRELLFREELKAKRIAKIKSKAYRRVHRKEKERQALKDGEFFDPEGTGEMGEAEREKADRRRAEERMGSKHRDSKWAKAMKKTGRAAWDEDARGGVVEMAKRNEELRRRIAGKDVHDSDTSDVSSAEDNEAGGDDGFMLRELNGLEGKDSTKSGLGDMKFMRNADARRKAQNDEDVQRLRKELAGEESGSEEEVDESLGRAIFGPRPKKNARPVRATRGELEEGDVSDEDTAALPLEEKEAPRDTRSDRYEAKKPKGILKPPPLSRTLPELEEKTAAQSVWLAPVKKQSKRDKQRAREAEEDVVPLLNTSEMQTVQPVQESVPQQAQDTDGWTTVRYDNEQEADSDPEPEDPIISNEQRLADLHRRAFAGDDVAAAFEAEKTEAADEEAEKEVSNHLPGWGSWTGDGLSRAVRKANNRQKHNPLFKTKTAGTKREDRKDAGKQNVIISEKQDRKGKKYLAPQLPHQFEAKSQYERSLRVPVGPEWTTKETFQRSTRPRVVVKPGIVEAMERPLGQVL